jgi:phosphoserine aminotransferase
MAMTRSLAQGPAALARPSARAGAGPPFSFAAGAGPLPRAVLRKLRADLACHRGTGGSLLDLPFTSLAFREEMERAEDNLRELLSIPPGYDVLFVHGGATAQFAAVPMNLIGRSGQADYLCAGYWSAKAAAQASRFGQIRRIPGARGPGALRIPPPGEWAVDPLAAYCHIVSNETADGVQHQAVPETGAVPLVADMSSEFLTGPIEVARYGLIYASAQKNLGIAGLAVVIVRHALCSTALPGTPAVLDYRALAEQGSLLNTPPTFAISVARRVTDWIREQGGLAAMRNATLRKSSRIYAMLDSTGFYRPTAAREERSRINLCFSLLSPELEESFLREADRQGLRDLKGHPACGGIRVSLYIGMPEAGAITLAEFMREFERRFG